MKILTSGQLKEADQYTILNEPIASIGLMERAGMVLFKAILEKFPDQKSYTVFCGPGNNGGDGLVVSRLFRQNNFNVEVIILKGNYTEEFKINFQKIKDLKIKFCEIENESCVEKLCFSENDYFVDALFGIGLSRPLDGLITTLIQKINSAKNFKIAIDIPSGLSPDALFTSTAENTIIADLTLTIQFPKLSFFFPENQKFTGNFEIIDIGLSKKFTENITVTNFFITEDKAIGLIKPRPVTGHKGTFGHALIIAGSEGKIGAALLPSKAALRTGCGLVTAGIPEAGNIPMLSAFPEAMILNRDAVDLFLQSDFTKYDAIGFGPGVGVNEANTALLQHLLNNCKQALVIDADGLTILSRNQNLYSLLNSNILLTPHPGEFDRLTHVHDSGWERFVTQQEFSKKYGVNILLKGHHTSITTPSGNGYFNSTGNNGMATAGSGDVLTGIITSLCAQGYTASNAAFLGAYLHGYAGDIAALRYSKTSMIASDIIQCIPEFFKKFEK